MIRTLAPTVALLLTLAGSAAADTIIITQNAASTGGSGAYSTVLNGGARSWLTAIGAAELNNRLPVGSTITGVSFRLASWQAFASWPAGSATFNNFDIYFGQAARAPGSLDLANANNNWGPDLTLCRSGPAIFGPAYFPGGAVSPNFNPFCTPITLATTYTYHGGDLLIMVRHTGNNGGNGNLDWVSSSFGTTAAQGIAVSSYTQNTTWGGGGNGGSIVMQLTYTPPAATCYPNCDQSTSSPLLTANDFQCFLNKFAASDSAANCDGSTSAPILTANDFQCFLNLYAAGCS